MREFIKGLLIVCVLAGFIVSMVAWYDVAPNDQTWNFRIGGIVLAVMSLIVFLSIHFQRDKIPDFLHKEFGDSLERNGLCFTFDLFIICGVCYLRVHFQNRYSQRCVARICLRYMQDILPHDWPDDRVYFKVDCPPACFGSAWTPIPVRVDQQGTSHCFQVGATVRYHDGKGAALRYREGGLVRTNAEFENMLGAALAIGNAVTGQISISHPACIVLALPQDVADVLPDSAMPGYEIRWRLGDSNELRPSSVSKYGFFSRFSTLRSAI